MACTSAWPTAYILHHGLVIYVILAKVRCVSVDMKGRLWKTQVPDIQDARRLDPSLHELCNWTPRTLVNHLYDRSVLARRCLRMLFNRRT